MKNIGKILLLGLLFFTVMFTSNMRVDALGTTLDCSKLLKFNSTGSDVITLQKKLNSAMKCNLETDGIFGSLTRKCVVKFQTKYNLDVDGIVGNQTCSKLNAVTQDKSTYVVVTADELNVRKSASLSARIITTVKAGSSFKVYAAASGDNRIWYKININGRYGYISSNYAKKNAIVLDISDQNLVYYKSGKIILDTNVVTGMKGSHDTPTGHYTLKASNMKRNRVLRGYNDDGTKYAAHVDYWMPFITSRSIGFHDASWRSNSEFRVNTYKNDGSHGCVNMMKSDAKTLFYNVSGTIDVIVKK